MKTTNFTLIFFSMMFLAFSSVAYSQGNGLQTIAVTLNVNTADIDSTNLATTCNFGQAAGISNEDFTINARMGTLIIWDGLSSNNAAQDKVEILAVTHNNGTNVLGQGQINSAAHTPGIVFGRVNNGQAGNLQKYDLTFRILNNGVVQGTYTIDPKIQIGD